MTITNNLKAQNDNKTATIEICSHANQEFKKDNDDLFHVNKELGTKIQSVNTQLASCHESLTIYSSFQINCDVEDVDGEATCVARNVIAAHPNMLAVLVDQRHSNLKRLQIVNSKFRFMTNSIFEQFSDLTSLEVVESELLDLNVKVVSNLLINLRIEGNFIQEIPNDAFGGVPNLKYLFLANNQVEVIQNEAFRGLSSLRKLDLRDNKITALNVNVLSYVQALTHLSLSNNRLSELPGDLLAYLRFLQVAKFDSNPITYIGTELLDYGNELEKIYFDGTCVRGTFNGIDETKLRIKNYCQRKHY
ncbi:leucine-rich repeat-containing protein 15-like [Chironomus tepperi]|uniref:leucine-rich repeat-containing protein 15-like n=1 Tax=Chironomus tepperi TaxID=113505 RepID=UPI00391EF51B